MEPPSFREVPRTCRHLELRGRVQGLGVRPAIARLAQALSLGGSVHNSAGGVEIAVEGHAADVEAFVGRLISELPEPARVEQFVIASAPPSGAKHFVISASRQGGPCAVAVPSDQAICSACQSEVADRGNRRSSYHLTTCTACGPRYSLIESMPYDRESSTMADFQQCARCQQEYVDPSDRRFHSQTNGCPECGPREWLTDAIGEIVGRDGDAIRLAAQSLKDGRIVAVRGIGGYQLLTDATSAEAIARLRQHKQRRGKPLAVLVRDLAAAEGLVVLSDLERQALQSPSNPIVVAARRRLSALADNLFLGLATVGVMLPTSALHESLARQAAIPLVVTSGNIEGDPILFDQGPAEDCLRHIADCVIHHDRRIRRPIDDSVISLIAGQPATMRLARGLAPLPLNIHSETPMVALGGHQKCAIALSNGRQAVLGPHLGDLENEATRVRFVEHFKDFCGLYDACPELLVHDEHPEYFTTRWAREQGLRTLGVQHHHAHVVSAMVEKGWLNRTVIGVAWDGTGFGPDGTIWGGEFLLATAWDYCRVGSLVPFALPGGEKAIREPWRVAVELVRQALGNDRAALLKFSGVSAPTVEWVAESLARTNSWPTTTSAGRLFDAAAALVLDLTRCEFEGQAAMLLEAACDRNADGSYPFPLVDGVPHRLDWRALIANLLDDLARGVPRGTIAMRFHRSLASGIAQLIERYSDHPIVLCGGCFYNRVLTELVVEQLGPGRELGTPGVIPVGDGGLAVGQLAVAAARLAHSEEAAPCA